MPLSAVVTGGASGLGRATVRRLLLGKYEVVIADLNDGDPAEDLGGSRAKFVKCDVRREDDVRLAFEEAAKLGRPSVLVNCAGVGFAQRTLGKSGEPHSLSDFRRVLDVNACGTFNAARLAAERFRDGGVIVNTASIAAYDGQRGQVAYAASKGAIAAMTLPLARDLAKFKIRVCAIAPGLFRTPLLAGLPDHVQTELASHVPFPTRLGDPDEFANLALAIIDNPMLNGEVIRLDGALRMPP
mmetsp:Transcript_20806/g.66977  ORF Transcript_20806/g.66977 Transcript_20806/m.66977 type:complete len:242 (+) Transcript_20806:55-780(+)